MDNNKKLFEELLKADGIDPGGVTETERENFRKMLCSEEKNMKRLSWIPIGTMWVFALALTGLCLTEKIIGALQIPFAVVCISIMIAALVVIIKFMPGHNKKVIESNRKVQKLYRLVYGKNRGVVMVGVKNGKRVIHWPNLFIRFVIFWMIISLSGAGFYYILCQRWLYSPPASPTMWFSVCFNTFIIISFLVYIIRSGLKTPLDELTEIKSKPKSPKSGLKHGAWAMIMQNRMTKFAAAATIIVAALIGINQFGGSIDGAGVVWADVIKNIEQIQTFSCQAKIDSKGMEILGTPSKPIIATLYNSSSIGRRVDYYIDKNIFISQFWLPDKNELIGVLPTQKLYIRKILSEGIFDPTISQDPYTYLKEFMSFEHTKLGRKKIDGIVVEGIEINDPLLCLNMFEKMTTRLWVDVKTNLPVLFEQDVSANAGQIRQTSVCDRFEWDVDLEADFFEPDIPDDYVLLGVVKIDNKSETMAIDGLRNYAALSDGQYPGSMFLVIAQMETIHAWQASINWEQREPTKDEREQFMSIQSSCFFHANLDKEDKDPKYYGYNVTAGDPDVILMRWKMSEDKYRIVFGDLTVGNASTEELPLLENDPAFQDILQRPRQGIKVKGIIGIKIDDWPAITVIPEMPAAKAGLQDGDVVIMVNGQDVANITAIPDAFKVVTAPVDEILRIRVKRNEDILDFDVERVPVQK